MTVVHACCDALYDNLHSIQSNWIGHAICLFLSSTFFMNEVTSRLQCHRFECVWQCANTIIRSFIVIICMNNWTSIWFCVCVRSHRTMFKTKRTLSSIQITVQIKPNHTITHRVSQLFKYQNGKFAEYFVAKSQKEGFIHGHFCGQRS